jgi:hypothetical protein
MQRTAGIDSTTDAPETRPKPKSKSYEETPWAYHTLHAKEKEQVRNTASSMKAGMDALMKLVLDRWGYYKPGFADFASFFESATRRVNLRCAKIFDEHMYWYAPLYHERCRDELDEGLRRLQAAKARLEKAGQADEFDKIKAQGEKCQQCLDAYADAWSAIRAFDAKHRYAWYQRRRGHHAFEAAPQQTATRTAEMRCLLQQMHELSLSP